MSGKRSALDVLSAAEKAAVLDELLAARPDLRQPAEAYATQLMSGTDRSAVAGDVEDALQGLGIEELNTLAWRRRRLAGRGVLQVLAGLRPGICGRAAAAAYPWHEDSNAARLDSAAASTRISHGLSGRRMGQREGATVSDKTARQEFGLTQDEINDAIDAGTLQYHRTYYTGTRG